MIAKYRIASTPADKLLDDVEYQTGAIEKDVFDAVYDELSECSNGFIEIKENRVQRNSDL